MPSKSILRRLQQTDDDFYNMQDSYEGGGRLKGADKYKDELDGYKAPVGMNFERSGCGDCLWGLIFICFLASMVFLTYLGFTTGEVHKLTAPVALINDRYELCGYHNETPGYEYDNRGYPNLVITEYPEPPALPSLSAMFDSAVCVKECPTEENNEIEVLGGDTLDASTVYLDGGSYDLLGLCVPTTPPPEVKDSFDMIKEAVLGSGLGPYLNDLYRASRSIYVSLAMSVVYSILFIYFLSAFGETIAWICVVILQLGFVAVGALGFYYWDLFKKDGELLDQDNQELV